MKKKEKNVLGMKNAKIHIIRNILKHIAKVAEFVEKVGSLPHIPDRRMY